MTDTERLNWLEANQKTVWRCFHEELQLTTTTNPTHQKIQVFDGWAVDYTQEPTSSIREAIDAAIKQAARNQLTNQTVQTKLGET